MDVENQHPHCVQLVMDHFIQSSMEECRNFTEEANACTCWQCWLSNMFTGESKAETVWISNKLASKEQLKNMSRQLADEVHVAVCNNECSRTTSRTTLDFSSRDEQCRRRRTGKHREEICLCQRYQRQDVRDMCWVSLLLGEHIIRICTQRIDLVRPIVHQKSSSCDMSVTHWLLHGRSLESETQRCQSAISSLKLKWRRFLD